MGRIALASDRHPWLSRFAADPAGELSALLNGVRVVPPYYRADAGDVLAILIGPPPANAEVRAALDEAMGVWLEERRKEPPSVRLEYGVGRYVGELTQALSIVHRLCLANTARLLFESFNLYDPWLEAMDLGAGYQPRREFLRAVADGQSDRRLKTLWLGLCEAAAEMSVDESDVDTDLLDEALIGLQRMPGNEADAGKALLSGLAHFGAALACTKANKRRFLGRWRAAKGLYPRTPAYWHKSLDPILTVHERRLSAADDAANSFVAWWRSEEFRNERGRRPATTSLPVKEERDRLIARIEAGRYGPETTVAVLQLIERYRAFAEATGDSYFLVMSCSNIAGHLTQTDPSLALHLVRMAREWEPNNAHLWSHWGAALTSLGRVDLAEWVLWEAKRRFPHNGPCQNQLAELMARHGRSAEAEALYRETIQRFPEDVVSRTAFGHLLLTQSRIDEAKGVLREALDIDPHNEVARAWSALAAKEQVPPGKVEQVSDDGWLNGDRLSSADDAAAAEDEEVRPNWQETDKIPPETGIPDHSGRLSRADFRLGPSLDVIGDRAFIASMRQDAEQDVRQALAENPNDRYAQLVAADRLPALGGVGEALLRANPHDYGLHLLAALVKRDAGDFGRLSDDFPEERPLTWLAGLVLAFTDATGSDGRRVARWLVSRPSGSGDLRLRAARTQVVERLRWQERIETDRPLTVDEAETGLERLLADKERGASFLDSVLRHAIRAPAY